MKKLTIIGLTIVLAGCSNDVTDDEGGNVTPPSVPSAPSVSWVDYPSSLKSIIDTERANENCSELQSMFNIWVEATNPSTGRIATDVAGYIDYSLEKAGCYK